MVRDCAIECFHAWLTVIGAVVVEFLAIAKPPGACGGKWGGNHADRWLRGISLAESGVHTSRNETVHLKLLVGVPGPA